MSDPMKMKVFSGTISKPMAEQICETLDMQLGNALVDRFDDGEVKVQIRENVRGAHVFIVNSTQPPAENLEDMTLLVDAAKRSSAGSITLVIPYLGYNRQDRKDRPRAPISAKVLANKISAMRVDRLLLFELHSEVTAGFFDDAIAVDHLYGSLITVPFLKTHLDLNNLVVASTDAGGVPRARAYAKLLGIKKVVVFDKVRGDGGAVDRDSIMIIGDVKDQNLLFVDDMIDTSGTLIADVDAATKAGAQRIFAVATHGVFSKNAIERLKESPIERVIVTDSFYHSQERLAPLAGKLTVLPCAPTLGKAMRRIHEGRSLSTMFL